MESKQTATGRHTANAARTVEFVSAEDNLARERKSAHRHEYSMVCSGATDQSRDWRDDPITVAEMLSPSTERIDRMEKFYACMQIPTLQECVLIDQDHRRGKVFRRSADWQREVLTSGDTLHLPSIGVEIAVDALYRRVTFDT